MAEIRRGFGGENPGSERLPWLEPVEDEDDFPETGGDGGKLALWIVVGFVAIAVCIGAFVWWNRYRAAHADIGEVIHAQPGPYKEKPADPGGLEVDESGVIAERMGTGNDIDSPIDLARIPEQPITGAHRDPAAEPAPPPAPVPAAGKPPTPVAVAAAPVANAFPPAPLPVTKAPPPAPAGAATVPVATGGGGTIQLGALASEAKAKQVWKALSSRFASLAPLTMSITPVKIGDATLYRLRASGGDARKLCGQLKVAGESCNVVN